MRQGSHLGKIFIEELAEYKRKVPKVFAGEQLLTFC